MFFETKKNSRSPIDSRIPKFDETLQSPPAEKPPAPPEDDDGSGEPEMSVEEQLRMMQRQLASLCTLPAVLQKSLAAVNEKICKLLPPEPQPEPEIEEVEEESIEDFVEEEQSYEYEVSREATTPEPEPESEQVYEEEESIQESEYEPEPEPEMTVEEIERLEKLRKMEQLNRAWPWSDEVKPVYKISDRYKVPHSIVFNNKIQDMESKMILRKAPELID